MDMTPEMMNEINQHDSNYFVFHMNLGTVETTPHKHTKGQLLYAEGGIVHVFIKDRHWYLPARCFIWIPAEVEHSILTYSKKVELYNFYFSHKDDDSIFYDEPNIYFVNDLLREMIFFTKDWKGKVKQDSPSKLSFLHALKLNLPEMKATKLPREVQHPFPKDSKLLKIAFFLSENLERSYSIEEVAKEFGLSTRTLSRKFKEQIGMNYVRFLRSLRITRALQFISENNYNMYEVALKVGYSSLSAFSNIFYKVVGIRPTEYANLNKQK